MWGSAWTRTSARTCTLGRESGMAVSGRGWPGVLTHFQRKGTPSGENPERPMRRDDDAAVGAAQARSRGATLRVGGLSDHQQRHPDREQRAEEQKAANGPELPEIDRRQMAALVIDGRRSGRV